MLMGGSNVKYLLFVRLVVPSQCLCATVPGAPAKGSAIHQIWHQPGGPDLSARPSRAAVCHAEDRRGGRSSIESIRPQLGFNQN